MTTTFLYLNTVFHILQENKTKEEKKKRVLFLFTILIKIIIFLKKKKEASQFQISHRCICVFFSFKAPIMPLMYAQRVW